MNRKKVFVICAVFIVLGGITAAALQGTESARVAHALLQKCAGTDVKDHCMADALSDTIITDGTGKAFRIIKDLYPSLDPMTLSCFSLTDEMGERVAHVRSNYRELKLVPESIYCNYGFIQAYSRESLMKSKDVKKAQDFCTYVAQSLGHVSSGAAVECYRGLGHALPFISPDIQGNAVAMSRYAIKECETLASEGEDRDACLSGLFSRVGYAEHNGLYGLAVNIRDPLNLCHALAGKYYSHCEGNLKRSIVTPDTVHDLDNPLDVLRKKYPNLSADDLQIVAFTTSYDGVYASAAQPDYKATAAACHKQQESFRGQCISGAAVGFAKNGIPGEQDTQVRMFCDAVARTEGTSTGECPGDQALRYMSGFFPRDRFTGICAAFGQHEGICARK